MSDRRVFIDFDLDDDAPEEPKGTFIDFDLDKPLPDEKPQMVAGVDGTFRPERMDLDNRARVERVWEGLTEQGFARQQQFFATGTKLLDGVVRAKRRKFEAMPTPGEALSAFAEKVRAEKRDLVVTPIGDLEMGERGELLVAGEPLAIEEHAFSQIHGRLCDIAGLNRGSSHHASLPTPLRRRHFGDLVEMAGSSRDGATMMLATRWSPANGRKVRSVYRASSEKYAAVEAAEALEILVEELEGLGGWKMEIQSDGLLTTAEALCRSGVADADVVVGEPIALGKTFSTGDALRQAMRYDALAHQIRCINHTILHTRKRDQSVFRHLGSREQLSQDLRQEVRRRLEDFGDLPKMFAEARRDRVIERIGADGPRQVFVNLVTLGLVKAKGHDKEELVERLVTAYQKDPQPTRLGITSAITRAAHENAWTGSRWTQRELEEQAGKVLHVRVWDRYNMAAQMN